MRDALMKDALLMSEEAGGGAAAAGAGSGGLAALFTQLVLRDGEIILLIVKPSLWFILIQSIFFSAVVAVLAIGAALAEGVGPRDRIYFDAAILLVVGRLMWAGMHWMGRLYVLTDQRILRLSGVFTTEIFDCPLRRVAQVCRADSAAEKIAGVGTIEIFPGNETRLPGSWQTVSRPQEVHAEIVAAINRAKC